MEEERRGGKSRLQKRRELFLLIFPVQMIESVLVNRAEYIELPLSMFKF